MIRFAIRFAAFFLSLMAVFGADAGAPPAVAVEVFSDFQCPFCARFAPPFRQLEGAQFEGARVSVTFRHFPLDFHKDAPLAHRAAYAAGTQGKFGPMHDLIFANQTALKRGDLLKYAAQLSLDLARFEKDLDAAETQKAIEADVAEGKRRGVQGTPTFFVNGRVYSGAQSFEKLKGLVDGEIAQTRVLTELPESALAKGPAGAPVRIEFFADLQSPVTRLASDVLDDFAARNPGVKIQFRNFPLTFNAGSSLAHDAAMIAARHGKFWEMARYLLDHQDRLREPGIVAQAGELGLDAAAFQRELQDHRYRPRVDADLQAGARRGVRGSPVIFVNDTRLDGVPSLAELTQAASARAGRP